MPRANPQKRTTRQSRRSGAASDPNHSLPQPPPPSSRGSSVKPKGSRRPKAPSPGSASAAFVQSHPLTDWHSPALTDRAGKDGPGAKQNRKTSHFTKARNAQANKAVPYHYPDTDNGKNKGLMNEDDVQNTEAVLAEASRGKEVTLDTTSRPIRLTHSPIEEDIVDSSGSTQIKKKDKEIDEESRGYRTEHTKKLKKRNVSSGSEDNGFLSIGGVRIYTDKSKDWYEEEDDAHISERGTLPSRQINQRSGLRMTFKQKYQLLENDAEDSEDSENFSSSEVEDDIAEDYIAGIEGNFMDDNLYLQFPVIRQMPIEDMSISYASDDTTEQSDGDNYSEESSDSDGESVQEAWNEEAHAFICEGTDINLGILKLDCSSDESEDSIYDLDQQNVILNKSTKVGNTKQRKKKSAHPQLTQQKETIRKKTKPPGYKKWQHAEIIAGKRQQRAIRRGFDPATINAKLENIVVNEVDMFTFQPMHKSDCVQIQKMASIYRLRSGSKVSGKRRFVTVFRTNQTSLPSANDRARLEAMLRKANEFTVLEQVSEHSRNGERNRMASKAKRATRQAYQSMKLKPSAKRTSLKKPSPSTKRTSRNEHRIPKYANQPLSFVSSGAIRSEGDEIPEADKSLTTTYSANQTIASSVSFNQIGEFEAHTRGFGSRMLAKMGFIEGNGLGKDSQGIAQPLQAVMRPKSLGLGA